MKSISATLRWTIIAGTVFFFSACAAQKPVFYPNAHYETVGEQRAMADAQQCMADAREHGVDPDAANRTGNRAAKGAAVGAVSSAVVSAVLGGNVGRAIGAGAAGGATAGAVSGATEASDPGQLFKRYVERCLQEKGYDVIGWR